MSIPATKKMASSVRIWFVITRPGQRVLVPSTNMIHTKLLTMIIPNNEMYKMNDDYRKYLLRIEITDSANNCS